MFGDLSHLALQHYWWFLVSLLGAILVFLMFVQGGQTLISTLGKTKDEKTILVNALGRKWEFTFTTLVTFGGAFFASFPLFYSTSFGGAYWVWMIILFAFVIQAIAYEFRNRPNNVYGPKTYETFLFINGLIGTIFIGTAVATFFTGSNFSVNELNQSKWDTPFHGLEAALNLHNLSLGLTVFFLARVLAILYFMNSVDHKEILERARKQLIINAIPFVVLFLTFTTWLLLRDGFAVDPGTKEVYMEPFKYFNNLIEMPLILIGFLAGVVLVLWGIISSYLKPSSKGIWFTGPGTIITVLMLLLIAGYNNTSFYPSVSNLQSSLTIENASSSHFTLTAMSYVSLMIPFVLAYIWYAWRAINVNKIDQEEIEKDDIHIY
ncbi:cytochrome d ubiquinol oxidase subunit II [Plebeiibacterium sediminum]|uniref:Cytochrome d ubiquinol oxidase subunit II n=1 Tax=Plebeiibacterium sediminum TaxID=2992112 RepID=A0AAE3SEF3_9BACT|nr:cytochrome d ubiquinol oxidase subunit II [Plebeiobacterium sediminum]MCW3785028.1 cytochrome d ubiquinol oxidase subunit II [Plebeiobacterium sediminum]